MADGGDVGLSADINEIAQALRVAKRSAERRANKEHWPFVSRASKGGQKRFYPPGSLPDEIRSALQRHRATSAATDIDSAAFSAGHHLGRRLALSECIDVAAQRRELERGASDAVGIVGEKGRERKNAKLDLLARLSAYANTRGIHICAVLDEFCSIYNSGQLKVPEKVRELVEDQLHPATLRRWRRLLKTQGAAALAGSYGNRCGSGLLDAQPELRDFTIGLLAAKPHIDGTTLHAALETRFNGHRIPSERSVQRWLSKWKHDNAEMLMAVANPDAWKNKYKVAFGSVSEGIVRANQRWELDSTPGDIDLIDGRHCIIGAIDVATRRMTMHVSKTSSAEGVCSLLRRAILDWGVPETVKIDNGRDYVSQRVQRGLLGLQIDVKLSAAFSPWEKPHIERGFRTFSHGIFELLQGYIGHNVAEAQELRSRESFADRMFKKNASTILKLTAAELQQFCDRWCNNLYAHDAHAGLKGETPFQRWASLRDAVSRVQNVRALDLLLAEAPDGNGLRTVSKKGIKLDRAWYIAPELHGLVRQSVQVLYDEADAGRVVVYHDGAFVCVAECPELIGVSRKEIATEARLRQNADISQKRRELKALKRKANTTDIAWDILDRKREQASQLSAFPAPNVVHMTPALEAAAEAADAIDGVLTMPPLSPADFIATRDSIRGEQVQDETAEQRFKRALDLLLIDDSERNDFDKHFLRSHMQSPEFNSRWGMFEDFGAGTFGLGEEYLSLLPAGAFYHRLHEAIQQGAF